MVLRRKEMKVLLVYRHRTGHAQYQLVFREHHAFLPFSKTTRVALSDNRTELPKELAGKFMVVTARQLRLPDDELKTTIATALDAVFQEASVACTKLASQEAALRLANDKAALWSDNATTTSLKTEVLSVQHRQDELLRSLLERLAEIEKTQIAARNARQHP